MPALKAVSSAAVIVTRTAVLTGPPFASRSGVTPRAPADDASCVVFFCVPDEIAFFRPPTLSPGFFFSSAGGASAVAAGGATVAIALIGIGLYETFAL